MEEIIKELLSKTLFKIKGIYTNEDNILAIVSEKDFLKEEFLKQYSLEIEGDIHISYLGCDMRKLNKNMLKADGYELRRKFPKNGKGDEGIFSKTRLEISSRKKMG